MSEHVDGGSDEQELLADLQHAGHLDEVPAEAVVAAKAGFAWRTLDDELASLVYDSLLDDEAMAGLRGPNAVEGLRGPNAIEGLRGPNAIEGLRGPGTARLLTFESPELTVEVEAAPAEGQRRLIGQLVPPQRGEVEVRHAAGTVTVRADEVGRFSVEGIAPGPVSLRCTAAGGPTVTTDWVLL